jgi:hypothetical protein
MQVTGTLLSYFFTVLTFVNLEFSCNGFRHFSIGQPVNGRIRPVDLRPVTV